MTLPAELPGRFHIYNQYVIRTVDRAPGARDRLKAHLDANGVGNAIYYPLSLHQQECFAPLGCRAVHRGGEGGCPESERAAQEVLALPVFPELSRAQLERVVEVIAEHFA